MKGSHEITITNNILHYKFTINRNITILRGNSATGKTTLMNLIDMYTRRKQSSGITVNSDVGIQSLNASNWELIIRNTQNTIFFIDEDYEFLKTKEFAKAIKECSNYFVIITRECLYNLPYSVDEIYELKSEKKKFNKTTKVYTEFQKIYLSSTFPLSKIPLPQIVITEDSNSGYDFFYNIFSKKNIPVISANGNSNIARELRKIDGEKQILVIADGAAFGAFMEQVYNFKFFKKITIYLPESFEFLILQSGIIQKTEISNILNSPSAYIESSEYFSWEQFFTEVLRRNTEGTYLQYNKKTLNQAYLQENEKNLILKKTPINIDSEQQ